MADISAIDSPWIYLEKMAKTNPAEAVRTACQWGDLNKVTPDQYHAAADFVRHQTVFPRCSYCEWPLLPGDEPHAYCEEVIRTTEENQRMPYGKCQKVGCTRPAQSDGICTECGIAEDLAGDPDYPEFGDEGSDDENQGCPHCGSHHCNTWDCLQ
jgi:hypothetical protein